MTKRVFFLGAGFSKALDANFPLMNELTNNVSRFFEKESVSRHYMEITPILKENVERLLTFLSTDLPWKTEVQKNTDMALYYDITQQIQKELNSIQHVIQDKNIVNKFFDCVIQNPKDNTFITLNYDLLLENCIIDSVIRKTGNDAIELPLSTLYSYPMTSVCARDNAGYATFAPSIYYDPLPSILKLHGSVNWYWSGVNPSDIIYYRHVQSASLPIYTEGLQTYIIPPVMDKNVFYNHIMIRHLWRRAREALIDADEIYIVGFSMPQSDLSVRFLFQSALESRTPKIFVVNIQEKQKLKDIYKDISDSINYKYTGNKEVVLQMMQDISE